jgi:DNA-binding transcriptional MerR regulator
MNKTLGPIQLARVTRTSIKALRYYERRGLLRPKRRPNGWRIYREDDIERLAKIQAFKQMGFGVAAIATLLEASPDAIAASLRDQELHLLQQRDALDASLHTLRTARTISSLHAANDDTIERAA